MATIPLEITFDVVLEPALVRRQGEAESSNDRPEIEDTGPLDVASPPWLMRLGNGFGLPRFFLTSKLNGTPNLDGLKRKSETVSNLE